MKIAYAPRALRDIDQILAYIRKRNPRGAHNQAHSNVIPAKAGIQATHRFGPVSWMPASAGMTPDFAQCGQRLSGA